MVNLEKFNLLEKSCVSCTKCSLSKERINVVFGRGNPKAKILIIGEGPGQQEDEQGLAFVGRAGKMLDKSFLSVGIDTNTDCYISNIVKCRPPKNRKPKNNEVENSFEVKKNLSEELEKLNNLLKDGVLTQEEFEKAKNKLLDN